MNEGGVFMTQLRLNELLTYYQPLYHHIPSYEPPPEQIERVGEVAAYQGRMTHGARKRLSRVIDLMLQVSPEQSIFNYVSGHYQKFRLGFVTLTAPPEVQELKPKDVTKHLLEPFIRWLRRSRAISTYIWKAELQGNGSIHYHFAVNRFIHHNDLRASWNKLMKQAGVLDRFIGQYGHDNPNSTDVHSVRKLSDCRAYLQKYLSKDNEGGQSWSGKLWDCSMGLKKANFFTFQAVYDQLERIEELREKERVIIKDCEHCQIVKGKELTLRYLLTPDQNQQYINHVRAIQTNCREGYIQWSEQDPNYTPSEAPAEPRPRVVSKQTEAASYQMALNLR